MDFWRRAATPPGGLIALGLGMWAMAWFIDLDARLRGVVPPGHHGGEALIRINFPMMGFPAIALGMILVLGTAFFMRRGNFPRYAAGLFIALDGMAHAFAINDHIGEYQWVIVFGVLAPAQVALGIALPFLRRDLDKWWFLASAALIGGYVVTRTVSIAAWGWPAPVEGLDVFSKFTEVMAMLLLAPSALASLRTADSKKADASKPADGPT
jgi:hypothetical protein